MHAHTCAHTHIHTHIHTHTHTYTYSSFCDFQQKQVHSELDRVGYRHVHTSTLCFEFDIVRLSLFSTFMTTVSSRGSRCVCVCVSERVQFIVDLLTHAHTHKNTNIHTHTHTCTFKIREIRRQTDRQIERHRQNRESARLPVRHTETQKHSSMHTCTR